jgi:TonB family protein
VSSLPAEAPAMPKVAVPTPVDVPTADDPAAHLDSDAPAARCESCGGPADEADLCSPCQQAFHSLLDSTHAPAPDADVVAPVVAAALAPAPQVAVAPAVVAAPAAVAIPKPPAAPAVAIAVAQVAPAPAVQAPVAAAAPAPVKSTIQIKKPPPAPVAEAPVEVAPPQPKAPRPAPVAAAVATTAPQPSSVRTIAAGAAVIVVVAAIGFPLGRLWLGEQETSPIILESQPAPVVQPAAAMPELEVTPVIAAVPVATTARDDSAVVAPKPAPATPVAAPAAKTTASATTRPNAARVPPKTVRKPVAPVKPAATVVPSPVVVAPAPEAPPAPVATPEPKPEPPAAPVGPFFELRDVNETPRVATRVEPQVPDELRDRELNEVVIVRVLVTQAGQPLTVNLLRKSKSGAALDNAIVAAVKQWTFVPARKRGEAVSCWFHVGVPVSRANH